MGKNKNEVDGYRCERCGHNWAPRKKGIQLACPRCKSRSWNVPKKEEKEEG